jgi:hypothetical protein
MFIVAIKYNIYLYAFFLLTLGCSPIETLKPSPLVTNINIKFDSIELVAPPGKLAIVDRKVWDNNPLRKLGGVSCYQDLLNAYKWIVVHHTAMPDSPGPKEIKRYHLEVVNFSDIGYHFVIGRDGTIYQGRDIKYMGAHAGYTRQTKEKESKAKNGAELMAARKLDPDWGAIGVVVDGFFFNHNLPSVAQHRSLAWLLKHLSKRFGILEENIISHLEVRDKIVKAQGLTLASKTTECPGPNLKPIVDDLRSSMISKTIPSKPTKVAVASAMQAQTGKFVYAYKDLLRRGKGFFDDVIKINFIISSAGKVQSYRVSSARPLDELFRQFVEIAIKDLVFPPSQGTITEIRCQLRADLKRG